MTKDKALDLALEALERMKGYGNVFLHRRDERNPHEQVCEAITAIKQARALDKKAENARELGLDYEPVCHICGGTGEMDSGGTLPWGESINIPCECTAPTAQPDPVQPVARIAELEETVRQLNHALREATESPTFMGEPVVAAPAAKIKGFDEYGPLLEWSEHWVNFPVGTKLYTTPPAAQRQWVGLFDDEAEEIRIEQEFDKWGITQAAFKYVARAIEAKLRSNNNG